jgi:hypothetical protein
MSKRKPREVRSADDGENGSHVALPTASVQAASTEELVLPLYNTACRAARRALAVAKRVDEVKHILDTAVAIRAYAKQARNHELEADAVELRMRATRGLDEMRRAQAATVGLAKGGGGKHGRKRLRKNPL